MTNSVQRMNEFASEMQNQEGFSNVLVANKDGDKFKVYFRVTSKNFSEYWLFRENAIHSAADLNFFLKPWVQLKMRFLAKLHLKIFQNFIKPE